MQHNINHVQDQGRVVRKPINANLRLKGNQGFHITL